MKLTQSRKIKRIILFNLFFCLLFIFIFNYYFDLKAKKAVAYFYAENYIETDYKINKEDLNPGKIYYLRGLGLFQVEVIDNKSKNNYFFEVDITDDYSLFYIKKLT